MVATVISFFGLQEVAFFGFPDGHITDYQRAARPALNVSYYLLAVLGLFFFIVTIVGGVRKKLLPVFGVASVVLLLILLVVKVGVPMYFGSLDNGVGG